MEKVKKTGKNGCWSWTGNVNPKGYGTIKRGYNENNIVAHRASWEVHRGPIPDGMLVLHKCDNPPCTNPDHLFLGTHQDNMDDMVTKERQSKLTGENHGRAKLTEKEVLEIRDLYGFHHYERNELALKFNISYATIGDIIHFRSWKNIK